MEVDSIRYNKGKDNFLDQPYTIQLFCRHILVLWLGPDEKGRRQIITNTIRQTNSTETQTNNTGDVHYICLMYLTAMLYTTLFQDVLQSNVVDDSFIVYYNNSKLLSFYNYC